jgi:ribosomal protein S12 methylthiotransferase
MQNRYYVDPFGCVKNQVDAENMMAYLNKAGWINISDAENADLIIVNSCGFIESAKQESINAVIVWRKYFPNKKILLAGCLARRYAKELSESLTEADGFFGTEEISKITEIASKLVGNKLANGRLHTAYLRYSSTAFKTKSVDILPTGNRPLLSLPGSAYIKISDGCNNRCSYCAIPLIRGNLKSRSIPDILEECTILLNRGIKELCIVAQDTGSFGSDTAVFSKLPELLSAISEIEGHFWVRLLYIHPDNFPLPILDIMEKDQRILPYFDIPFQHASQRILSEMNRRGTAENYLELLSIIRKRLSKSIIRSTFLLGFPGETEKDFMDLLVFQEKASFDWLGFFTYSREENTASFSMKNHVSKRTATKRKQIIEEKQIPITEKNMERFTGQTLEVLIEEQIESVPAKLYALPQESGETIWLGRLFNQAPEVDSATVIINRKTGNQPRAGELVLCKIIAKRGFDLLAEIVSIS